MLSPAPTAPTTVATSTRVPAMQGLPNRTSGSIVIPGNTLHDDLLRSHGPEHLHFSNDGATIIVARLGMWNRLGTLGDGGRPLTSSAAEAAKAARQDEVSASPLRVIG